MTEVSTSPFHIIDETDISATIGKCLRKNDVVLPFITVDGNLEALRVGCSDKQLLDVMSLAVSSLDGLGLNGTHDAVDFTFESSFDTHNYLAEIELEEEMEQFLADSKPMTDGNNQMLDAQHHPNDDESDDEFFDASSNLDVSTENCSYNSPVLYEIRKLDAAFTV